MDVLKPYDASSMEARPVRWTVNPKNDGPECVEGITSGDDAVGRRRRGGSRSRFKTVFARVHRRFTRARAMLDNEHLVCNVKYSPLKS